MRTARPLGLSPDGRSLIVVVDGEQLAIPADDKLRAALRNDRARMGQLEIEMESALRPRDIQARIRAGESLEAVAQAAGVPMAQIEPFAAPVIAEREHIAGLAQSNPVRRAGDAVAHRSLRAVVSDRLLSRGIDADSVDWDAWRSGERRWTVRLSYESGSAHRQADFTYDQTGRFSVAANEDARWLTGEHSSSHGPQPGRKRHTDEASAERSHDDNDELAIVRAIQPQFEVTPDIDDDDDLLTDSPDNEDAFAEGDLAEVDGVYDIIPGDRSNMDVLYDMLSTFDEDSVQIYAGLVRPAPDEDAAPVVDNRPAPVEVDALSGADSTDGVDEEDEGEPTAALDESDDEAESPADADAAAHVESDADDVEESIFAEVPIVHSPAADEPFVDEADAAGHHAGAQHDDEAIFAEAPIIPSAAAARWVEEDADADTEGKAAHDADEATEGKAADDAEAVTVVIDPQQGDASDQPPATEPDQSEDQPSEAQPEAQQPEAQQPESEAPPRRPTGRKRPVEPPITEPEQPSLVDEAANEPSRPIKRKRASVPSWDEIMFGSPKPKE